MINLKTIYDSEQDIYNKLFENDNIVININGKIYNGNSNQQLLNEALDNIEKTSYASIMLNLNESNVVLMEHIGNNSYDNLLKEIINEDITCDNIQTIFENICNNYKLLNKCINIGVHLPRRTMINEAYDSKIDALCRKHGQGLRNVYDWLVYQTL